MRAVAGRPNKVRFRFEAEDGTLTNVDASTTVSVVVKAGDGTQLATGTAALDGSNTGIYAYTLPAQTQLDVLTATATGIVGGDTITVSEEILLVDRRIAPLSMLRQDPVLAALTVMDFLDVVDRTEDAIETELNFSPVLRGVRAEFRSRECTRLFIPGIYYPNKDRLYALTRNDEDQLSNQLAAQAIVVRETRSSAASATTSAPATTTRCSASTPCRGSPASTRRGSPPAGRTRPATWPARACCSRGTTRRTPARPTPTARRA